MRSHWIPDEEFQASNDAIVERLEAIGE